MYVRRLDSGTRRSRLGNEIFVLLTVGVLTASCHIGSRLSFLLQNPGPQKGFRRGSEGVSEGVSEKFLRGFRRGLEGVNQGPSKTPARTLRKPFKKVSKSMMH